MRRKDREKNDPVWLTETLARADACHLALFDGAWPYVVSLNYGFELAENGRLLLWFHCAREGKKLELLATNPHAAFIIDTGHELVPGPKGCDWGMKYRSIAGRGILSTITDPALKKKGLDLLMAHHAGEGLLTEGLFTYDEKVFDFTAVLCLEVESFTGKEKA